MYLLGCMPHVCRFPERPEELQLASCWEPPVHNFVILWRNAICGFYGFVNHLKWSHWFWVSNFRCFGGKSPQFCCEKGHEETKGLGFYRSEWNQCWKTFQISCWWCSVTMVSTVRIHQAVGITGKQMHWCWWPYTGEVKWTSQTLLKPWRITLASQKILQRFCLIDSNFNSNIFLTQKRKKMK